MIQLTKEEKQKLRDEFKDRNMIEFIATGFAPFWYCHKHHTCQFSFADCEFGCKRK